MVSYLAALGYDQLPIQYYMHCFGSFHSHGLVQTMYAFVQTKVHEAREKDLIAELNTLKLAVEKRTKQLVRT